MAKLDLRARPRRAVLYGEVIVCELGLDEPDQLSLTIRVDARHGEDLAYWKSGQLPPEGMRVSVELAWLSWPPGVKHG